MIVVVDTNVAISGLLWTGPPNHILKWARDGLLRILACQETTDELRRAIQYGRLAKRISELETFPARILSYYMNLVFFVPSPEKIPGIIVEDPFDNIFLGLATENNARLIISGDKHLTDLKQYHQIEIVKPDEACNVIEKLIK
ncbi:MAG TPA: putative toxin-antitoxin system toxin component, PIN family [Desulfobacterales bacterium]|nr:putative toxin-antitoxin system toxin component, PIN family [Desulfobacterales bacterium]